MGEVGPWVPHKGSGDADSFRWDVSSHGTIFLGTQGVFALLLLLWFFSFVILLEFGSSLWESRIQRRDGSK